MGLGDTSDLTNGSSGHPSGGSAVDASEPRELSRAAAVAATVLAIVCGSAVVLAMFHWLGWSVPGVGWLVAKGGIKLAVGGFAGLAAAFAWLRTRLGTRRDAG
ncbi:hypothetical protein F7Q99_37505 [Streptomyces kaniharaensis]|uniref:Uncharacterized protein n=1 Tax=Streptomyces kaniharaensis TaxID=212423 RepID=A0A6N7L183_9ACTN|nr:hypothetical protein [Streptomyces kaniharaensis]MQS17736.1 hypothetical protein [Streptomyces kaniharaensis]